jgi:hypothetical protein
MDGMVWIEWMGRYGHYGKIVWIDEMNVWMCMDSMDGWYGWMNMDC